MNMKAANRGDLPLHLVQETQSDDTVECIQGLLDEAKKGECVGIAFAAIYRKPERAYIVNSAGECNDSPTFTLGMLSMLADHLRGLERGKTP